MIIIYIYIYITPPHPFPQLGLNDTVDREALEGRVMVALGWNPPMAELVRAAVRDCPQPLDLKVTIARPVSVRGVFNPLTTMHPVCR